ncbi:MAG: hypothetical protein V3S16_15905, partial [Candidatus Desulfatibia sp.]|uniref:hypothetical protein n=1 Tax=Candidatus Desulfatibia sp. TaxID=3101189 RepID=UPI002F2FC4D3
MQTFIEAFPISKETGQILLQVCKKYNIRHEKEIVDIYRHRPDLFFEEKSFSKECYPLDLSRKHQIHRDRLKPWVSVYGGKFTSCVSVAEKVEKQVRDLVAPSGRTLPVQPFTPAEVEWDSYPGLQEK